MGQSGGRKKAHRDGRFVLNSLKYSLPRMGVRLLEGGRREWPRVRYPGGAAGSYGPRLDRQPGEASTTLLSDQPR